MGQTKSKDCADKKGTDNLSEEVAVNGIDILRRLAALEGPTAVSAYIDNSLNRWKGEQVTFAISGRSAIGKSHFINTIRNLKPGDDGFAKMGGGNTTKTPTLYKHPRNDQIAFCDLPGYATTIFRKEDYISKMKMSDYDVVLIFFNTVLSGDDIWLVDELRKLGKPFALVRTKIDVDIDNAKYDGKDPEMIQPEIKKEIQIALNANPELKDTEGIFLISSRKPDLGEWSDLMMYLEANIAYLPHIINMGQTESKELVYKKGRDNLSAQAAVDDINILRRLAEREGPIAVSAYIDKNLYKWKNQKVTFAITGRSVTGKSTFVNTIRNLKPGDDGFAKSGSGGTTKRPTFYIHPKNDQILFCDLPGYSSIKFKKKDYISEMKISDYDFFFIVFDKFLGEEEIWMVGELRKLGKPFFLVRSNIDIDIDNAKYDSRDQEMVIPEIKEEIEIALNANPELKDTNGIFLISCRNPKLGEMSDLMAYVEDNINGFKAQVLLLSLDCITKKIVERKYKMLQKRIVAATAHAARVGVPLVGVGGNIIFLADEVRHYIRVFGVDPERVNSLKDFDHSLLKCRFLSQPNLDMTRFVTAKLDTNKILLKNTPFLRLFLPLVGSVISSATVAAVIYKFLDDMLQDIKDDVVLLHEHIMKTNANQRMSQGNTE